MITPAINKTFPTDNQRTLKLSQNWLIKSALTTPERSVIATRVPDFTLDREKLRSMLSRTIEFIAKVKVMRNVQAVNTARKVFGVVRN